MNRSPVPNRVNPIAANPQAGNGRGSDGAEPTNVLLTCAGRRNYLLDHFRQALAGDGQVFAADSDPLAPAMQEADLALVVPPVGQEGYVECLLELCERHRVRLLCSVNDLELPILAEHRARFDAIGTTTTVSSPEVIRTCADKWQTYRWLRAQGIRTPRTFRSLADAHLALALGEITFPLVVKPRWGTASIGIELPTDAEELNLAHRLLEIRLRRTIIGPMGAADPEHTVLVQERLGGGEYGMDVVNDLEGLHVCTFVRCKLAMRAGETDRAVTVADDALHTLGADLGRRLGHRGNLDCDVFVDGGRASVLELNPRFGGGYPFSHAAGADVPAALLAWARGREARAGWLSLRPGVVSSKCDHLVSTDRPAELVVAANERADRGYTTPNTSAPVNEVATEVAAPSDRHGEVRSPEQQLRGRR